MVLLVLSGPCSDLDLLLVQLGAVCLRALVLALLVTVLLLGVMVAPGTRGEGLWDSNRGHTLHLPFSPRPFFGIFGTFF